MLDKRKLILSMSVYFICLIVAGIVGGIVAVNSIAVGILIGLGLGLYNSTKRKV